MWEVYANDTQITDDDDLIHAYEMGHEIVVQRKDSPYSYTVNYVTDYQVVLSLNHDVIEGKVRKQLDDEEPNKKYDENIISQVIEHYLDKSGYDKTMRTVTPTSIAMLQDAAEELTIPDSDVVDAEEEVLDDIVAGIQGVKDEAYWEAQFRWDDVKKILDKAEILADTDGGEGVYQSIYIGSIDLSNEPFDEGDTAEDLERVLSKHGFLSIFQDGDFFIARYAVGWEILDDDVDHDIAEYVREQIGVSQDIFFRDVNRYLLAKTDAIELADVDMGAVRNVVVAEAKHGTSCGEMLVYKNGKWKCPKHPRTDVVFATGEDSDG